MPTTVNIPEPFLRQLRRLGKKYPTVVNQLEALTQQLKNDERPGDKIPNVGYDVYKVRLANPSAQRGKSGGFRIIYYVQLANSILLVTICSKTEQSDISPEEIRRIVEDILPPLEDENGGE